MAVKVERVAVEVPPAREFGQHGDLQTGTRQKVDIDVAALEAAIRLGVSGEVRFDDGTRAMYSTDASNYRQVPIGVVIPRTRQDIIHTVAACHRFGAPILARGGGTSIPGQCCNVAVVMDMSKYYNRILEIDADSKLARVQPGVVLDEVREAAEKSGLTFGPDPATHSRCTLGGMIGNNSCGVHSVMAGRTADNIEALEVLTYDGHIFTVGKTPDEELQRIIDAGDRQGEIYRRLRDLRDRVADKVRECFPRIPRRVSGYNLDELLPENGFHVARALVGTECTCVIVLEAVLNLVESPPGRSLLVLGYPDVFHAADHVPEVLKHKPIGLEAIDKEFLDDVKLKHLHPEDVELMPEGGGWLLVEFGGKDRDESDSKAKALMEELKKADNPPVMKLFDDPKREKQVWEVRDLGLGATTHVPGQKDNWEGWEDTAVPPDKVGPYLRDFKKLLDKYDYHTSLYGHFGDGCIHCRMDWDLVTAEGIAKWKRFLQEGADLVLSYGGSLSGEHGDGQARGWLLPKMFGEELVQAFREFKAIWDPDWKMNPGKVVDPYNVDENLRLGTDYNPWEPKTRFLYPADKGSFARAANRCVGAGVCRQKHHGTMCPSYQATHEEMHSTRGRARLLFEMLEGDPVKGGWKSEAVKEALDLCLSCKGCKGECPVHVDMATYKAEFLSHYYEGRLRPIHAYAYGLIHWWARLASKLPLAANLFTQTPVLSALAKKVVGMPPQRRIPPFAPYTFKSWFANRESRITHHASRGSVILWPDTFNDHFHPTTAQAAVEVLEDAGFAVDVPMQDMCCGRPLYDYGMVDTAKKWFAHILDTLRPQIRAGIPVVVLEPSCASVFRDELPDLFPHDEDAARLSAQTFLLSEFLQKRAPDYEVPKLHRKALVHGHCHHKAVIKMTTEEAVLQRMEIDYAMPDTGCCGMAGAFGFEGGDHYEVSMKCGERVLLPEVRGAAPDTLIIADGFSCREQISQTTDRQAIHLAQALQMAIREGEKGTEGAHPEDRYVHAPIPVREVLKTALVVGGVAALGLLAIRRAAGRRKTARTERRCNERTTD
jgi:FAD/FMN-containing dehydrogenase/Fe-S oxidoreductase